jgi:fructose-1-phosphate kinase PfkB-like protein
MTEIAGETRRNLTLQIGRTGRTIKINHPVLQILPAEFHRMATGLETLGPGSYLAVCADVSARNGSV